MELQLQGTTIAAFIDDATVATVRDSAHSGGLIGIGSSWSKVQFDNLVDSKLSKVPGFKEER